MKKKQTQRGDILRYLQTHKKGLTSKEAIEKFGATRLSSQIYQLKKQGWNIISEETTVKTKYGTARAVTYKLIG